MKSEFKRDERSFYRPVSGETGANLLVASCLRPSSLMRAVEYAVRRSKVEWNSEGLWQNNLSAERFKIILPMKYPAKGSAVMLGEFSAFRWKNSIAGGHRRR